MPRSNMAHSSLLYENVEALNIIPSSCISITQLPPQGIGELRALVRAIRYGGTTYEAIYPVAAADRNSRLRQKVIAGDEARRLDVLHLETYV